MLGQSYFVTDGTQLYLILQPPYYTLKRLGDTGKVVSWKPKGLLTVKLTTPTTTDNSLSLSIKMCKNSSNCLIFQENFLKQKKNKHNFYSLKQNNIFYCF